MIARPVVECVLFGSMVILARIIPPADFGRYSVALVFAELMLVPSQAVGVALVQRRDAGREYLQTGEALSLLIGVAIIGITLMAAKVLIVPIFGEATANLVRLATAGCLMNAASVVPSAVLQRRLEFRRMSVVQIVNSVVRAGASIALAIAGLNAAGLVLGGLIGGLVGTVLVWTWSPPHMPRLHKDAARELGRYGLPAGLAAVSWVGFRNCDYAIVGARLGALQAGFYFRAYTLGVEYQKKVSQVMNTVGFPLLARAKGVDEQAEIRRRMVHVLTLILFPVLLMLGVVAPVLIPWVFGPEWAQAIVPTQILAIGGAVTLVIDAVGASIMAAGRARALLGYGWAHFLVYGTSVLIIAPLGIVAVALTATVVHTAFMFVAYIMLLHKAGEQPLHGSGEAIKQLWLDVSAATVSCCALAAVVAPLGIALSNIGVPAFPYLAIQGLVAVGVYLGVLHLFYPASFQTLGSVVRHLLPARGQRRIARRTGTGTTEPALSGEATR